MPAEASVFSLFVSCIFTLFAAILARADHSSSVP